MNWREFPFLKILPAYLAGILLSERILNAHLPLDQYLVLLGVALVCAAWIGFQALAYRQWPLFSIWCWVVFLILGIWRQQAIDPLHAAGHFAQHAEGVCTLVLVAEEVRAGGKTWKVAGRVESIGPSLDQQQTASGEIMAYLRKGGSLHAGNVVVVRGRVERISDNPNPDAFNYAAYLRKKGIFHQVYAGEGAWVVCRKWGGGWWEQRLYAIRRYCLEQLGKALPDAQAYAIGAALILGNRERMESAVRDVFSRTGAMHVLAVSGLHVGMVAWGLGWLMKWIPLPGRWGRWVKGIFQVSGIWAYALLCGAGASVTRAALMFSWLMLGKTLERPANIWNTLSGTALILLLADPRWLFDIGFQLSFLAVAGIVLFEPLIYRLLVFRWKPLDYLWKLTAVGFAAQLATSPLGIFNFHQFPLLFWLSGWIAVPVSGICQGVGLVYMLLGHIPGLQSWMALGLNASIQVLLLGMRWIDQIPNSCLQGLWLSEWGAWCIYLLLLLGASFLFFQKKWMVWAGGALLLLSGGVEFRRNILAGRRQEVYCYGIRGASALEFWQGTAVYAFYSGDASKIAQQTAVFHARQGKRSCRQIEPADTLPVRIGTGVQSGPLIAAGGMRFYIWDGAQGSPGLPPEGADYWILRNSPYLPVKALEDRLPRKGVIVDGSNAPKSLRFYHRYFGEKQVPLWDTMEKGAWKLKMR